MGKSVFDIAALLDVLAPGPVSYLDTLSSNQVKVSIGVADPTQFIKDDNGDGQRLFKEASELLGGLVKCTDIYIEGHKEMAKQGYTTQVYKAAQRDNWREYLGGCEGDIHSLGDVVAWHEANPVRDLITPPIQLLQSLTH